MSDKAIIGYENYTYPCCFLSDCDRQLMGYAGKTREFELQEKAKVHALPGAGWTEDAAGAGTTKTCTTQITEPLAYDKNTPASLKTLRWSIYEVIDNFQGDYGKTIAGCLKQEVERLFKEHTDS